MKRPGLSIVALALLTWAPRAAAQESALQAAVRLTGEARYAEAIEAANAGEVPLQRAQGELYAYHRAGALEDALRAGLRGLEEAPKDTWTLEQTAYVALSLGAGELAVRLVERLDAALPAEERSRLDWMRAEALRLAEQRGLEGRAQRSARLWALVGLGVSLLAFAIGMRPLSRPSNAG